MRFEMKLLCVGQKGQLAQALIERSTASQIELVAVGRPSLDLHSLETIQTVLDDTAPDIVINTAAYTNVDAAETDSESAYKLNAEAVGILASATAAKNLPLIHISSDYVFDGSLARPYTEEDPVSPIGVYGESKRAGEVAIAAVNPKHVILRTAWLYSPFGKNFLKTMLRLAARQDRIGVVTDQFGNPTNALDLADAILRICRCIEQGAEPKNWGIFHATSQGITSWAGFAQSIFEHSRKMSGPSAIVDAISTEFYQTAAKRPKHSALSSDKLKSVYQISLPDWQTQIGSTVSRLLPEVK